MVLDYPLILSIDMYQLHVDFPNDLLGPNNLLFLMQHTMSAMQQQVHVYDMHVDNHRYIRVLGYANCVFQFSKSIEHECNENL